jgi:hypothetical protein
MNSIIEKLFKAEDGRPTRFHDGKGNLVTPGGYIYAVNSFFTTFLLHSFGYRPPLPWLSYRAQRSIAGLVQPDWIVLEFGSGMSTAWFAKRCHVLYSFEHDPIWYNAVKAQLSKKKISNVVYSLRNEEKYPDLTEFEDGSFDFVLIDGIRRADCVRNMVPKTKSGGWIYLDDTDRNFKSKPGNDYQQAEQLLLNLIQPGKGTIKYFTDFAPSYFFVKQGILAHLGQGSTQTKN